MAMVWDIPNITAHTLGKSGRRSLFPGDLEGDLDGFSWTSFD